MKKVVIDSGAVEEPDVEKEEEVEAEAGEFPEEYLEPLHGLLFFGKLTDELNYAGHVFSLKTLTMGELIKAGQLIAKYQGTVAYDAAYKSVVLASCVEYVDGQEVYTPISKGEDILQKKFEVVMDWFPITIDKVYDAYLSLEKTASMVADSLGESSGGSSQ